MMEAGKGRRDREIADVLDNLRRVFKVVHRYSKRAEKVGGMTGPQVWAMKVIAESAPIRVTDLARRMYLHPSTVVGILDRLEQHAQVARTRSEKDHRVVTVSLTAKGRETVSKVPQIAQGLLLKGLQELSDEDLRTTSEGLRRLVGILGVEGMPPPLLLSPEVNASAGEDRRSGEMAEAEASRSVAILGRFGTRPSMAVGAAMIGGSNPTQAKGTKEWRRGWDSNPRGGSHRQVDFESTPLRPLRYPSARGRRYYSGLRGLLQARRGRRDGDGNSGHLEERDPGAEHRRVRLRVPPDPPRHPRAAPPFGDPGVDARHRAPAADRHPPLFPDRRPPGPPAHPRQDRRRRAGRLFPLQPTSARGAPHRRRGAVRPGPPRGGNAATDGREPRHLPSRRGRGLRGRPLPDRIRPRPSARAVFHPRRRPRRAQVHPGARRAGAGRDPRPAAARCRGVVAGAAKNRAAAAGGGRGGGGLHAGVPPPPPVVRPPAEPPETADRGWTESVHGRNEHREEVHGAENIEGTVAGHRRGDPGTRPARFAVAVSRRLGIRDGGDEPRGESFPAAGPVRGRRPSPVRPPDRRLRAGQGNASHLRRGLRGVHARPGDGSGSKRRTSSRTTASARPFATPPCGGWTSA